MGKHNFTKISALTPPPRIVKRINREIDKFVDKAFEKLPEYIKRPTEEERKELESFDIKIPYNFTDWGGLLHIQKILAKKGQEISISEMEVQFRNFNFDLTLILSTTGSNKKYIEEEDYTEEDSNKERRKKDKIIEHNNSLDRVQGTTTYNHIKISNSYFKTFNEILSEQEPNAFVILETIDKNAVKQDMKETAAHEIIHLMQFLIRGFDTGINDPISENYGEGPKDLKREKVRKEKRPWNEIKDQGDYDNYNSEFHSFLSDLFFDFKNKIKIFDQNLNEEEKRAVFKEYVANDPQLENIITSNKNQGYYKHFVINLYKMVQDNPEIWNDKSSDFKMDHDINEMIDLLSFANSKNSLSQEEKNKLIDTVISNKYNKGTLLYNQIFKKIKEKTEEFQTFRPAIFENRLSYLIENFTKEILNSNNELNQKERDDILNEYLDRLDYLIPEIFHHTVLTDFKEGIYNWVSANPQIWESKLEISANVKRISKFARLFMIIANRPLLKY